MNEDAVEALNDILDALQDVLEDPVFTARQDAPRSMFQALVSFWRNGYKLHDDEFVIERLELLDEQRPGKLIALARALERAGELRGLQGPRDRNPWYKLAIAPLILPQLCGAMGLLKLSTREAQWALYYGVWLAQAVGMSALASLISPHLVPGVILWCVFAEMMEKDLDAEELLASMFLFRMLRASMKLEHVLDLCWEKGVEAGRLLTVSERFAIMRDARRHAERYDDERPRRKAGGGVRVNLLGPKDR
jgi:hypothetical protein